MSTTVVLFWTAVLSFMPISELRGAIPFAIANGIPWYWAFLFAVGCNALVAPACWIFLATVHRLFYGSPLSDSAVSIKGARRLYRNFFDKFVERARKKLSGDLEKWGWLGIAVFVGIPLPVTGAWTGTLGSWVLGVFIAGIIVSIVVILGIETFNIFLNNKWRTSP